MTPLIKHLIIEGITEDIKKKYKITKVEQGSIGFSEENQTWYGWSHRACVGFKIGDKIFDADFGDENTPFIKHGSKTIKTLDQAKQAAKNFADYIS